jgi:tRNA A37 N6-isopentenylltransferase MiaA
MVLLTFTHYQEKEQIMLENLSMRKKILLLIGGTISVLLIIASSYFVNHIATLSRQGVEREAQSYLYGEKLSMESFFAQYGKLVNSFVTSPHMVGFF